MANYKDVNITKISDTEYRTHDTVNAGYLNRGESLYVSHDITFKLIDGAWTTTSIIEGSKELVDRAMRSTAEIKEQDKYPDDALRARRANTRHRFALMIHLGIKKAPVEKDQNQLYIKQTQFDYRKLEKVKGKLTPRRFTYASGTFHNHPNAVLATEENIALYEEYNQKFEELEELRKEIFGKLFNK